MGVYAVVPYTTLYNSLWAGAAPVGPELVEGVFAGVGAALVVPVLVEPVHVEAAHEIQELAKAPAQRVSAAADPASQRVSAAADPASQRVSAAAVPAGEGVVVVAAHVVQVREVVEGVVVQELVEFGASGGAAARAVQVPEGNVRGREHPPATSGKAERCWLEQVLRQPATSGPPGAKLMPSVCSKPWLQTLLAWPMRLWCQATSAPRVDLAALKPPPCKMALATTSGRLPKYRKV